MKFKTIIFDLDGTIADTLPLCIAAFKKSVEPLLQKEISEQEIIATFGPSEEGTIRKLIPAYEQEGVAAYLQHYEALHHTCPHAFTGIKALLEYLKAASVQLAMVTGKGLHSTRLSLKQFGLAEYQYLYGCILPQLQAQLVICCPIFSGRTGKSQCGLSCCNYPRPCYIPGRR
jgi:phosphoglycolate phosphatase-like HAD superfamily hydrolase